MDHKVSNMNSVDYAAWHIPCYGSHNCPTRMNSANGNVESAINRDTHQLSAGPNMANLMGITSDSTESAIIGLFLWILIVLSLVAIASVGAALCTSKGLRRPGNIALISVLVTEALMVIIVVPLHAIHTTSGNQVPLGSGGCHAWLLCHLFLICVKSWTWPAIILLFYMYDGNIPRTSLVAVLLWIWTASGLLIIPAGISMDSFMDTTICTLVPRYSAMVIYICVIFFLLPSVILAPLFLKWSSMTSTSQKCQFIQARIEENPRVAVFLEKFLTPSSSETGEEFWDPDFPPVLITLAIAHALILSPFFLTILITPVLTSPVPTVLVKLTTWLGYSQSLITPLLIMIIMQKIRHVIYVHITCSCKNTPDKRSTSRPSISPIDI